MNEKQKIAVVAGVGPGLGAALARRFAAGGYQVALLARGRPSFEDVAEIIPGARGFECDVSSAVSVRAAFSMIRSEMGDVDVLLFNAGSGVWGDVESISPHQFEDAWRVNAFGGFLCSREVIPAMKEKGSGSIVFVGATASRRGGPKTAAFAPAKAAQRSLAESMAKSLGPKGIHVALMIVDGMIDTPGVRRAMPDNPNEFFLDPNAIAEMALQLVRQDRSAWSFELDVRPFGEKW